jgi:hypothetical protein
MPGWWALLWVLISTFWLILAARLAADFWRRYQDDRNGSAWMPDDDERRRWR